MKHLFFLLISLSLFSCTKHREIKIIGRNAVTGEGYEGLQYEVLSRRTGKVGKLYKTEATGNLDANGEAFVSIKQKNSRTYSIRLFGPSNSCYSNKVLQFFDSPDDVNGTFTFEFAGCVYLNLNINNINCEGPGDIMNLRAKQSYTEWHIWSNEYMGCISSNSSDYFEVPEGWTFYEWKVNRNGIITNFKDSIFLSPGGYGIFNMNY
jgi:hypothetical protein